MDVVLDKSYLDGASARDVHELCRRHRVLMSDALFYELVTTDVNSRERCFAKIPLGTNSPTLVENVGALLRYENEHRRPCLPINQHRIKDFEINPDFRPSEFRFTNEDLVTRKEAEQEILKEARSFVERFSDVGDVFIELSKCGTTEIPSVVEKLTSAIANDPGLVRDVYATTIGDSNASIDIPPEQIGRNWMIFRWVQVQLLYSLELHAKYRGEIPVNAGQAFWTRMEHDLLDSHYVALGILAGALASRENRMRDHFRTLNPKGMLFS